jgi:hypothetical protein
MLNVVILICVSAKVFRTVLFFTCRWRGGRVGGCQRHPGQGTPPATAGAGLVKPAHQKRIDEDYRAVIFKQSMGARNRVGGCRGQPGPGTPPAAAGAGLAKPAHQQE